MVVAAFGFPDMVVLQAFNFGGEIPRPDLSWLYLAMVLF